MYKLTVSFTENLPGFIPLEIVLIWGISVIKYPVQNLVWSEIESVSVKVTVVDELELALKY